MQNINDELKMTHTCMLLRGNEKIVRVSFEKGSIYAEGILPSAKIEKQSGFTEDEVKQLENYLKLNKNSIMKKAKEITGINHWLDF